MPLFGKPNIEKMKWKQDFKGLCKALGHKDKEIQSQASNALIEMGGAAVEPLIAALDRKELRNPAMDVLIKIGEKAVEPLIAALNNMKVDSLNRVFVVRILGEIRDKRAVEHLIKTLQDTNTPSWICDDVADALGNIGDERAVEPLIAALSRDRISGSVAMALCKIGDRRAIEPLLEFLQNSTEGYRRYDHISRSMVIEALGSFGDKRAVEPIICAIKDFQTLGATYLPKIVEALGRIGDERAVEPLIEILQNSDQLVSSSTLTASGITLDRMLTKGKAWGNVDQKTLNNMISSGQQMDRGIQISTKISTIVALGRIGDAKAVEALTATLTDQDPRVRVCALEALTSIGQHLRARSGEI